MAEAPAKRPSVISKTTLEHLQEFLEFRYLFIRFDTDELDYQKTERKAKQVSTVFDSIFKELDAFITYLEKENND